MPDQDTEETEEHGTTYMTSTIYNEEIGEFEDSYHYDGEQVILTLAVNENGEQPTGPALGWVNSARIVADPDDDAVHVSISVADPRGAFVMTVRRKPDGTLLIHLPHPGESMPHAKTEQLHPGTLKVVPG